MSILRLALCILLVGFLSPAAQPQGGEKWEVLVGVGQYEDTSINPLPYAPGAWGCEGRRAESSTEGLRPPKVDAHVRTQGGFDFAPDDSCTQDDR